MLSLLGDPKICWFCGRLPKPMPWQACGSDGRPVRIKDLLRAEASGACWNVSIPAQKAGIAAMKETGIFRESRTLDCRMNGDG